MEFGHVPPSHEDLVREIERLKKERNAVILVHNYQLNEVQEIGDFVGDSLELSRKAANLDADVIVFCGVHFMAETAAMLAPDKTVLLPVKEADCPMARMATADEVRSLKKAHPDAVVITYVNSTAETKAEADYCCTSANAAKIVQTIPEDRQIIFAPDQHLGEWVTQARKGNVTLWPGYCPVHVRLTVDDIEKAREAHPDALVMVHPECTLDVCEEADIVASTGGMVRKVRELPEGSKIIVGTELGMISRLRRERPDIEYIPASNDLICADMKMTRLVDVWKALNEMQYVITVPEEIASRARRSIERMLEVS